MRIIAALLTAYIFIAACTSVSKTKDTLHTGETLFRSRCSTCHRLPDQGRFESDQWIGFLKEHGKRSRLTESEVAEINTFILQQKKGED